MLDLKVVKVRWAHVEDEEDLQTFLSSLTRRTAWPETSRMVVKVLVPKMSVRKIDALLLTNLLGPDFPQVL